MCSSSRINKKLNQIVNWSIFLLKFKLYFVLLLRPWQFFLTANVCGVAVFGYEIKETLRRSRKNNANCSLNATTKKEKGSRHHWCIPGVWLFHYCLLNIVSYCPRGILKRKKKNKYQPERQNSETGSS